MEMINHREQATLIGELTQGRQLANQLKNQLDPEKSRDTCEALLEKIVSTYDRALSVLELRPLKRQQPFAGSGFLFESSHSPIANSAASDCSDRVSEDQECQNKDVSKKRKTLPRWSKQVRVCSGTGPEGPLDDGHSWRKYGQKDILGAKFPRAYYRCTHRNTQGCLATKQVQRSDEDSSFFEVTYKGRHSCIQASNSASKTTPVEKEIPKLNKPPIQEHQDKQRQAQETLTNHEEGLKVETEDLNTGGEIFPFCSFSFPPIESENVESQFFSVPLKESDLMSCYSPAFLSPASSESNYFSSPCQINNFIISSFMEKSESDLNDAIATPTSVTNSPFGDLDISIDQVDFDQNFPLDTLSYFS